MPNINNWFMLITVWKSVKCLYPVDLYNNEVI